MMLYSCTHMATVGVKGLPVIYITYELQRLRAAKYEGFTVTKQSVPAANHLLLYSSLQSLYTASKTWALNQRLLLLQQECTHATTQQ